jgi:hypothetical protein
LESSNPPIDRKWLELINSARRNWSLKSDYQLLDKAFFKQDEENILLEKFKSEIVQYEFFFLAKCVSEICQKSLFLIYSDNLCCSGILEFESGKVLTGQIFGLTGERRLIIFEKGIFRSEQLPLGERINYSNYLEKEFTKFTGEYITAEQILDSFYENDSGFLEIPLMTD